jgi:hypothetical protein
MLRILLSIGLLLLLPFPSWSAEEALVDRLVFGAEESLAEIYPEADRLCVVSQYKTKRQILRKHGIYVPFWNNPAVHENQFMLVLIKGREVIEEQTSGLIIENGIEKKIYFWPVNTCVDTVDTGVKIIREMSIEIYSTVNGTRKTQIPSRESISINLIR